MFLVRMKSSSLRDQARPNCRKHRRHWKAAKNHLILKYWEGDEHFEDLGQIGLLAKAGFPTCTRRSDVLAGHNPALPFRDIKQLHSANHIAMEVVHCMKGAFGLTEFTVVQKSQIYFSVWRQALLPFRGNHAQPICANVVLYTVATWRPRGFAPLKPHSLPPPHTRTY